MLSDAKTGHAPAVTCPECGSVDVRLSRSSYPQDKERIGGEAASFWRCGNCGSRFLGRFVAETLLKRSRHSHSAAKSGLDRQVRFSRSLKRWTFPLIVILLTVIAVIYLLDRRDPETERISEPR